MKKATVLLVSAFLSISLSGCSSDYSDSESPNRIDYESGFMWAGSLAFQLAEEAEASGSANSREEGHVEAATVMKELYGTFESGCRTVVESNFEDEFPAGSARDAWVQGCVDFMNSIEERWP
jgi:hypothetical protein